MKISILHPSRGRPQKAFATAKEWIEKIGAGVQWEYIQSIDYSDPAMQSYVDLFETFPYVMDGVLGNHTCVVQATNNAASRSKGDILFYLSDDFKCPEDWGIKVIKEFDNENRPLLVKTDDCLQKFHIPVLTIPIMNRLLYERLGYFWHPDYKSMFVDEDLYWTCFKIGAIKMCEHLKFPHEHPANGKAQNDDTYIRSSANWDQGKTTFSKRKLAGFPL